jgi:hypothetical protein
MMEKESIEHTKEWGHAHKGNKQREREGGIGIGRKKGDGQSGAGRKSGVEYTLYRDTEVLVCWC